VTFIELKKTLLDAEITLPKFSKLIKVSEKNLQSYKKKDEVPNAVAVSAVCFAKLKELGCDYKELIESLELKAKTKAGSGFAKTKKNKKEKKEDTTLATDAF
jgi:hypothetical protein